MRSSDSRYDSRRWQADSRRRRPRRREARWAMLLGLVGVVAMPVIDLVKPGGNTFPLLMLFIVGSTMSPFTRKPFLSDSGFAVFDEFERQALLMALRRAYLISLVIVCAIFAWLCVAQRFGWPMPDRPHQWFTLGTALLIVMAALPVVIAEWTVPFPDPADEPI